MKIAVISDLHLGAGRADLFQHDESRFLRFLDFLESNFERVVLLGDIYETLSARPGRQVRELRHAREAHPTIVSRFERPTYTYLHGNHDFIAGTVDATPDVLRIQADGVRLAFLHGHQFDWAVRRARWLTEWISWASSLACQVGLRPMIRAAESIERLLMGVSARPTLSAASRPALQFTPDGPKLTAADGQTPLIASEVDRFQGAALTWATAHEVDVVITGHTHAGVVAPHESKLFLNSGSCADGAFNYLSLDTASGRYSLESTF